MTSENKKKISDELQKIRPVLVRVCSMASPRDVRLYLQGQIDMIDISLELHEAYGE